MSEEPRHRWDPDEFDSFIDRLIPDGDSDLTADDYAVIIRQIRVFMNDRGVPIEEQSKFFERFLSPILKERGLSATELNEVIRKWTVAFGGDLTWLR